MPRRPITLAPVRCLGQPEATPAPPGRARAKAAPPPQSAAERAKILRQNYLATREKWLGILVMGGMSKAEARARVEVMFPD